MITPYTLLIQKPIALLRTSTGTPIESESFLEVQLKFDNVSIIIKQPVK